MACKCKSCDCQNEGRSKEEIQQMMEEFHARCLAEYGYYMHYVGDDFNYPTSFNAHSHGLNQYNGHLDFQLILPLDEKTVHAIISNLAERVKEGEVFNDGDIVNEVIRDYPIKLVKASEGDREVLRIILPDEQGNLDEDKISANYSDQYANLHYEENEEEEEFSEQELLDAILNAPFVFWQCPDKNQPDHKDSTVSWNHSGEKSVATCDVCGKTSV